MKIDDFFNELIDENSDFKNDFELKFAGRIDDKILEKIENSNLKNLMRNLGYLSHSEANNEMQNSDILLITNFPNENSKGLLLLLPSTTTPSTFTSNNIFTV